MMFQSTKLTFIPSQNEFLLFKEFQNQHLYAMFKADSIYDSLCCQHDILQSLYADDKQVKFTVLDSLFVFLDWRMTHVDDIIEIPTTSGNYQVSLTQWFSELSKLVSEDWAQHTELTIGGVELDIEFGLPTLQDDMLLQKQIMIGGDSIQKRLELSNSLNSYLFIQKINGQSVTLDEKRGFFDSLPSEYAQPFIDYAEQVSNKFNSLNINLNVDQPVQINIEVIPILIQSLFGGRPQSLLEAQMHLNSSKFKVSYSDYMNMTPAESRYAIEFLVEQNRDNVDTGEEEMG